MAYLNCLPPHYNWSIIFRGRSDNENKNELGNVGVALINSTITTSAGIGSLLGEGNCVPKETRIIITKTKAEMVKDALRAGVSRWISNAYQFLESKHIIEEYKEQFPQMYSYLIYREQIPYEKMSNIHYEIVETITECKNSEQAIDKKNKKAKEQIIKAKTMIDFNHYEIVQDIIEKTENEQIIKAKKIIDFYKKKDFECNKLFLEIELNYMKTPELYEEYFILKNLKNLYNPNNRVYDILYNTNIYDKNICDIFITSYAKKLIKMQKTKDIRFLEYLDKEKINYIQDLLEKANPTNNL
jgi:hypothetical protein